MTTLSKDEVIAMAREAGFAVHDRKQQVRVGMDAMLSIDSTEKLERFAPLCRADLVAEISQLQQDCQTEAATVAALRAIQRLRKERNELRAELSALRVELGEAVKFDVATLISDAHFVFNNPPGECSQDVRDVIEWFAASLYTVHAAPQPSAVPVVRELVEALEMLVESVVGVDQTSAVNDSRAAITKGQQWLKECGE